MKRALAKFLFPKLHRFDGMKRVETILLLLGGLFVGACLVAALVWHNSQIYK